MGSYLDIFALVSHRSGISGGRKSAVQSIIFDDTMTHSQQERKKQRKPSKAKATVSIKCGRLKKKKKREKEKGKMPVGFVAGYFVRAFFYRVCRYSFSFLVA